MITEERTATVEAPQQATRGGEQSRARYPDEEGFVERNGARIFYEVYGEGERTLMMLPTWTFHHSRTWKMQIPYFARHNRVLTFDGVGNGRSSRIKDPSRYAISEFVEDTLAVMDATDTDSAVMLALSRGAQWLLELAADHPERVDGAVFVGPMFPVTKSHWSVLLKPAARKLTLKADFLPYRGWLRMNPKRWRDDYAGFVDWWARRCISEPHSTKAIEDGIGWALDTDGETLGATTLAPIRRDRDELTELAERISVPVLVIHGDKDKITPFRDGKALAKAAGGKLERVHGGGHFPHARRPVQSNLAIRDLVEELDGASSNGRRARDLTVHRGDGRPRALFISSPIGLGHAQRDVAIARELREIAPDVEIDWLAQDPVTRVLEGEGERIHPASEHLASESRHIESESAEHDLHCFQALRRMDEILLANFMVFHDVATAERYDLWVADEAWDLDYYLHENPNEKRANFAWLTDFVGFLPMPGGGEHEAFLTADHNAQMVDHIAQQPQIRDRALFVGNPDDIVAERLGPQLPLIRDWTERNFDFSGYVTGFDPKALDDREKLRAELGYRPDEQVCIVTVGGSGVGATLLRRVIASFDEAKELVPALRMIVVCGPRIDAASLPQAEGLEVRPYVHNLYRHLAACDLAVVQGGLTTSMELTANKRPFLYFPLREHFEQNFHVRHRLEQYGAGRRMDFDSSSPETIARAIAEEIGRDVDYRDVETDGARRAAARLAEMLD